MLTHRVNGDPVVETLIPTPPPQSYCQTQISSGTSGNIVIQSTYLSSVVIDSSRVEFYTGDNKCTASVFVCKAVVCACAHVFVCMYVYVCV